MGGSLLEGGCRVWSKVCGSLWGSPFAILLRDWNRTWRGGDPELWRWLRGRAGRADEVSSIDLGTLALAVMPTSQWEMDPGLQGPGSEPNDAVTL